MVNEGEHEDKKAGVLSSKLSDGPRGIGDPDDKTLRKVEKEVMIPRKMREKAQKEKCIPEVAGFTECCKNGGLLMSFKCRQENKALKDCLTKWYQDEEFQKHCQEEYLNERSEFRLTGVKQKHKKKESTTF